MKTNKTPSIKRMILIRFSLAFLIIFGLNFYSKYSKFEEDKNYCFDEDNNKVNLHVSSIYSSYRTETNNGVPFPFLEKVTDEIYEMEKFVGLSRGRVIDIIQIRREHKGNSVGYELTVETKNYFFPEKKLKFVLCPSENALETSKDSLSCFAKGIVDHEMFHAIDCYFGYIADNPTWRKQFFRMLKKSSYCRKSIFSFMDIFLDDCLDKVQSNENAVEFFAYFSETLCSKNWENRISKYWSICRVKDDYLSTLYTLDRIISSKDDLRNTEFSRVIKKRIKFLNKINNQKLFSKK